MKRTRQFSTGVLAWAAVIGTALAIDATDDVDKPPTLNQEQRQAVGIVLAHPQVATTPEGIEALGQVLDPATLVADSGEVETNRAAERADAAEVERLRSLYSSGAGASLKALQAAQADLARAHAQADSAAARFASRWGPLTALSGSQRQAMIDAVASGKRLLLRADLPGRHSLGAVPDKAMVDVDGIQVEGLVLGVLTQAAADLQSAGVLVQVEHAPIGFGPGARVPVALLGSARSGLLVPRDALLYDERGAYVYRRLSQRPGDDNAKAAKGNNDNKEQKINRSTDDDASAHSNDERDNAKTEYARVPVTLLMALGDSWLVDGLSHDDDIVVHGAGVLWSLQGLSSAGDDDD